jgi:signal transduction histidine kinase
MKLLTKTGIYYLVLTLVLFAGGGIIFYFTLQDIINESITDRIYETKEQIISYAEEHDSVPPLSPIGFLNIQMKEVDLPAAEKIQDTLLPDEDDELKPQRTLTFPLSVNGKNYSASITRELVESDELIESIGYSLAILTGLLLVVLLLFNWWLSKNMWKPFYTTLDKLKDFDLNKKETIRFSPVNISEFRILNEEIQKMTDKILRDYQNLKEFTENASHEIQTPLAIIRSRLELLIQAENLTEEQAKSVQSISESVNRLSKLNQSLLLLAKIENRQFRDEEQVDLKNLIEKKLEQFEDMIAFKNIRLEKQLEGFSLQINPQLADILLSNILTNAIRHNISGGKMIVDLKTNSLSVSNSGNPLEISPHKMFGRFQKASPSGESVGLGLSIVKQICDTHGIKIQYLYKDNKHTVELSF